MLAGSGPSTLAACLLEGAQLTSTPRDKDVGIAMCSSFSGYAAARPRLLWSAESWTQVAVFFNAKKQADQCADIAAEQIVSWPYMYRLRCAAVKRKAAYWMTYS